MHDRRTLRAFLIAPLVAPATYAGSLIVLGIVRGMLGKGASPRAGSILTLVGAVAAIGVPIAYVATVVVGVPAFVVLRRVSALSRAPLLAVGGITGIAVAILIAPQLRGELFSIPFPWWAGALVGIASAEVFWRLLGHTDGLT